MVTRDIVIALVAGGAGNQQQHFIRAFDRQTATLRAQPFAGGAQFRTRHSNGRRPLISPWSGLRPETTRGVAAFNQHLLLVRGAELQHHVRGLGRVLARRTTITSSTAEA